MMKVKFNKFERIAGLFVGIAIFGFAAVMVGVAVKQGWFEKKLTFLTEFESADGIHKGSAVQMSGIKVGSVEDVELTNDNRIHIRFTVTGKFADKVKQDSVVSLVRPFIIGERILEISVGNSGLPVMPELAKINSTESVDLMTIMSGKKLGNYLANMNSMMDNLKKLMSAFADGTRTDSLISTFDKIEPLVRNLNSMSIEVNKLAKQANKDERLGVVLSQLAVTTNELNTFLPAFSQTAPVLARDMGSLVSNMTELTKEFKVVIPALAAIAPDLPKASRRAIEGLDEAVVLLKAMQKSFFLRSSVSDVREEEAKRPAFKNENREPASK
jgi:phospholipid/cholesterol/gamma-HCH transport system substrate-binding protein